MGKTNKKSKTKKGHKHRQQQTALAPTAPDVTMEAIMAESNDEGSSSSSLASESEWNDQARQLKASIEQGKFDALLQNKKLDDDESIEEVELASSNSETDDEGDEDGSNNDNNKKKKSATTMADSSDSEENDKLQAHKREREEKESDSDRAGEKEDESSENESVGDNEKAEKGPGKEKAILEDDSDEEADDDNKKPSSTIAGTNGVQKSHTLLRVVTESITATNNNMPWPETFAVIPSDPLPFTADGGGSEEVVDIHDDLKREVAFYDHAMLAVNEARERCQQADIPFTRPDDFFADMVKTDEHMAKIKDRLIFENKKMQAVAQRKSNKEQKLRAKESHANKLAEKAKRKKEHFRSVQEYAQTVASNRTGNRRVNDDDNPDLLFGSQQQQHQQPSKKRAYYDKKYGFGGKRGRFKQNDPQSLNDMSGFNPRGNFPGIGTRKSKLKPKNGSGANRKGKRARDASRR